MAPSTKRVLVLGASGVIGKVLTNALLDAAIFEKVGIFTSVASARSKQDLLDVYRAKGADVIVGELSDTESVARAFAGFDTIVSALGRSVIEKQIDLIKLAESCPTIVRFIPSEYGTDVAFDKTSASERPSQAKLKVRAFLESTEVQDLTYTYLVTGPFADLYVGNMGSESRIGSFDVALREATLLGDGNGPIGLTSMRDVGQFLVAVLKNNKVCDGKAVKVASFTASPKDILAEMERQTGSQWTVRYTSQEELRKLESEAWSEGNPMASMYTLRRIWTEGRTQFSSNDNNSIGVSETDSLETVVRAAVACPVAAFQSGDL